MCIHMVITIPIMFGLALAKRSKEQQCRNTALGLVNKKTLVATGALLN